jgi:nitroreductase
MNQVIDVIKKRRSVREFEPKPVPGKIIRDILDCARLAPTALNIQPWLLGAVTDVVLKREIADMTDHGKFIKDCAVCFAVFADSTEKYFLEDGCAATDNILLACKAYGIASCWVAGHKKGYVDSIRELLKVPEPYTLVSLIAAGYSNARPSPPKKPLDEVMFFNVFTG